ncbi:bifunctional diaminohydroxyphosphoribosylaminopyrimidine deaminase/5-amino-6-(5-phosphoribosylamino)uracil reductase RibD [Longispora urticae]
MRRAIELSARGLGTTSPNPPVGCVILNADGAVVGEGFHVRKGEPHAEVHALRAAGESARGGTAYVTLEPCNHFGRTPPCHQALIDAGIERVHISVIDPTSRGEGGAARLRAAGLAITMGLLEAETLEVLGPWLHALQHNRPHVTWSRVGMSRAESAKWDAILTIDGKLTEGIPGGHGEGVFSLDGIDTSLKPAELLTALYAGGVRRLLLDGDAAFVEPFLAAGLVDAQTPGTQS